MPPAWYAASVHIYGSRGAAYVSPLCFRSDRAADGGAALCRACGLRPGPAGGAGPLRRTAAFVPVPVPDRVHFAGAQRRRGIVGRLPAPGRPPGRGPRALRRRRFADGPCGRVCAGGQCGCPGGPHRQIVPARGRQPPAGLHLLGPLLCDPDGGRGDVGQRRAGGASVRGAGAGGAAVGGCPQPAAPSGKGKASRFRPFERHSIPAAAPPAGRGYRGRRPDLLQAVRVHPVFPAAGRRFERGGARAGPARRHAAGSVLGLRPGFPGRALGQLALLRGHQPAGGVRPAAGAHHLPA